VARNFSIGRIITYYRGVWLWRGIWLLGIIVPKYSPKLKTSQ